MEVEPEEDILPVRAQYSDTREGLNIGVNYLSSSVPFIYAAPDVYASALLYRAKRLASPSLEARRRRHAMGLKPLRLGGQSPIDPCADDLFRKLIEERVRVKNSHEYPPSGAGPHCATTEVTANSLYGIFAEMNREELPSDPTETIGVFGHGEPFEQRTNAPEELGEYCFPPIAALIASGARLMLALLERCVTVAADPMRFVTPIGMAIIGTETGSLSKCGIDYSETFLRGWNSPACMARNRRHSGSV